MKKRGGPKTTVSGSSFAPANFGFRQQLPFFPDKFAYVLPSQASPGSTVKLADELVRTIGQQLDLALTEAIPAMTQELDSQLARVRDTLRSLGDRLEGSRLAAELARYRAKVERDNSELEGIVRDTKYAVYKSIRTDKKEIERAIEAQKKLDAMAGSADVTHILRQVSEDIADVSRGRRAHSLQTAQHALDCKLEQELDTLFRDAERAARRFAAVRPKGQESGGRSRKQRKRAAAKGDSHVAKRGRILS